MQIEKAEPKEIWDFHLNILLKFMIYCSGITTRRRLQIWLKLHVQPKNSFITKSEQENMDDPALGGSALSQSVLVMLTIVQKKSGHISKTSAEGEN